jgi:hypothetical protein
MASEIRVAPTGTGDERHEMPAHRYAPAHAALGKINEAVAPSQRSSDQEGADTDPEHTSQESVQRRAVRQDVSFCDRPLAPAR